MGSGWLVGWWLTQRNDGKGDEHPHHSVGNDGHDVAEELLLFHLEPGRGAPGQSPPLHLSAYFQPPPCHDRVRSSTHESIVLLLTPSLYSGSSEESYYPLTPR